MKVMMFIGSSLEDQIKQLKLRSAKAIVMDSSSELQVPVMALTVPWANTTTKMKLLPGNITRV